MPKTTQVVLQHLNFSEEKTSLQFSVCCNCGQVSLPLYPGLPVPESLEALVFNKTTSTPAASCITLGLESVVSVSKAPALLADFDQPVKDTWK